MAEHSLPPHLERMVTEYEELKLKCLRLNAFIEGPDFEDVDGGEQVLLKEQYYHMDKYKAALKARLCMDHNAKVLRNHDVEIV